MEEENLKNYYGKNPFKSNALIENATTMNEKDTNQLENSNIKFESTTITNLNNDCMEAIFEYLGFNDLCNIAESSKQFYVAACEVYKRNYAKKTLVYNPPRCFSIEYYERYSINHDNYLEFT